MIEPTDEMYEALFDAGDACGGEFDSKEDVMRGLAAVLAVVERDVVPEAYGLGRDDEAADAPMAVTLDEINARRGRPW